MAPKKRGRPAKAKKDANTAPAVIEDDIDDDPPPKKAKSKAKVEEFFQSPVKKQVNDAQFARTKGLTIPVDETCPLSSKWDFIAFEMANGCERG
jgi:hypothetical protein